MLRVLALCTVIAGSYAAICCMWAFVITGPMQQYAAYAGPAHCNHKPYAATCGMWALVITGPVQQYAGYADPVHCNCKLCAAICNIWAFVITAISWPRAASVQSESRLCAATWQKNYVSVQVSRSPSKKKVDTPARVYKLAG